MPYFEQINFHHIPNDGKATVLFLHGFLGSVDDWRPFEPELAESLGILAVDLPGHGESQTCNRDEYSFPNIATKIVRLFDHLALERVNLAGYSMGGRLALYLLTHFEERFDQVLIESASPGLKRESERQARVAHDRILADKLRLTPFEDWLTYWYAQPLFDSLAHRPDLLQRAIKSKFDQNPETLAQALELMSVGYQENLWPKLSSINMPLLFIAGEQDTKYAAIARETARLCPNGRAVIIEQAGHNVHLEQPEQYIRQLKQFFQNQP